MDGGATMIALSGTVREPPTVRSFRRLGRCRLCWRVTAAVFAAILVIEAAILYVSARGFERDRLRDIETKGRAAVASLFLTHPEAAHAAKLLEALTMLLEGRVLAGGAFYRADGGLAGAFGEAPALALSAPPAAGLPTAVRSEDGRRYDVAWSPEDVGSMYAFVARLDTAAVEGEVRSYAWRVMGLVFLISAFVTGATMAILGTSILSPLLALRERLLAAAERPDSPEEHKLPGGRRDEIGDVASAFNGLLDRLAASLGETRRHQAALKQANEGLERQVAERTAELTDLNAALVRENAERRQTEEEVRKIARVPHENPNPVVRVCGRTCAILYANPSSARLLDHWDTDVGSRLPPPWSDVVQEVQRSETRAEHEVVGPDWVYALTFHPVAEWGYVNLYARDITESRKAEERIRHLATHDALTGLPNRELLRDRLEQALRGTKRAGAPGALHLVDLDNFKDLNDSLGHPAGDTALVEVARRLRLCVRESDTVARLGGDEFAIVQADLASPDEAAVLARRVIGSVSRPCDIEGQTVQLGASVGITLFPDDSGTFKDVLAHADLALYKAKAKGGGTFRFFVAEMNAEVRRRIHIERDLRRAVERGEFVLHFQPKLKLSSGAIAGMEALIRWRHPEQGFLSPAEFIPVAEKSRLIEPMGEWALMEAATRAEAFRRAGLPPLTVAVNVSPVQLRHTNLPETVRRVLDRTGLDPGRLELEITETAAMEDAKSAEATFRAISGLGVSIAIDDFGTGYSSLNYLRRFPVQRVKIDKSFVDGIGDDADAGAVARAVTTIGRGFGMGVTAEGVETPDQAAFLRDIGCDEIQGYYVSKPLPADDFVAFMQGAAAAQSPAAPPRAPAGVGRNTTSAWQATASREPTTMRTIIGAAESASSTPTR
jgi:diguanylate cyclase (GGDEF)-like protein